MSEDPLILSLETATLGGSVWLGRGRLQLAARRGDPLVSQSSSLLADIDHCLQVAGVSVAEIDLFACASGPGSFTGLRIGIATLKALAATLDRPCVGIPTLRAVAHSAGPSAATVALLPAGRGEVFAQLFSVSSVSREEIVKPVDTPAHIPPEQLIEKYGGLSEIRWVGSGAQLQRGIIENAALARDFEFADFSSHAGDTRGWMIAEHPENLAANVAALALQSSREGITQRADQLHAIYVRPSDAELAK